MVKMSELQEIVNIFDRSSANVFTLEYEGFKIRLENMMDVRRVDVENETTEKYEERTEIEDQVKDNTSDIEYIVSPMVGTFYTRPNAGQKPFVEIGTSVKAGKVVCVLEAMKLFNEVKADVEGEIVDILVKDGDVVEYGQELFVIRKSR